MHSESAVYTVLAHLIFFFSEDEFMKFAVLVVHSCYGLNLCMLDQYLLGIRTKCASEALVPVPPAWQKVDPGPVKAVPLSGDAGIGSCLVPGV